MLPLIVDPVRVPTVLIGGGPSAERRLEWLDDAGAADLQLFAPRPSRSMRLRAGRRLRERLPDATELASARIVYIADLDPMVAGRLCELAHRQGALVNVEDVKHLCDDVCFKKFRQQPTLFLRGEKDVCDFCKVILPQKQKPYTFQLPSGAKKYFCVIRSCLP